MNTEHVHRDYVPVDRELRGAQRADAHTQTDRGHAGHQRGATFLDLDLNSSVNIAYTKTAVAVKGDIANKTCLTDGLKTLPTGFTYDSSKHFTICLL